MLLTVALRSRAHGSNIRHLLLPSLQCCLSSLWNPQIPDNAALRELVLELLVYCFTKYPVKWWTEAPFILTPNHAQLAKWTKIAVIINRTGCRFITVGCARRLKNSLQGTHCDWCPATALFVLLDFSTSMYFILMLYIHLNITNV